MVSYRDKVQGQQSKLQARISPDHKFPQLELRVEQLTGSQPSCCFASQQLPPEGTVNVLQLLVGVEDEDVEDVDVLFDPQQLASHARTSPAHMVAQSLFAVQLTSSPVEQPSSWAIFQQVSP